MFPRMGVMRQLTFYRIWSIQMSKALPLGQQLQLHTKEPPFTVVIYFYFFDNASGSQPKKVELSTTHLQSRSFSQ